jgi:GDSL-like Lipase/Acylhydrolase family
MQETWLGRHDKRNSLGFRDVEPGPGTRPRLVVVGDSYAFGWGINRLEDRYGEQLASMLGWESVNAAIPNTHTLQHIELLKKVLPLHPRVVVLLYVFNDIEYLAPVRGQPRIPLRPLFDRSHLYQQLALRFRGLLDRPAPSDPYMDKGLLAQHASDLRRFTDLAGRGGALVGIVPFPRMWGDRGHYERLVKAVKRAGAPVWPIARAFAGYELSSLWVSRFDTHPNELAHRIAAQATLPFIPHGA